MCLADNNLVQRNSKKKFQRSGLAKIARLIIDSNMVSRELLGLAKKSARETIRALTEARVFRRKIGASVNVPPNQ